MKNIFIVFFIFFLTDNYSQSLNLICNKNVVLKTFEKFIPKEVCIPKGYVISVIYTEYRKIDFNSDGLNDCIFQWHKEKLQDGDTIFVTFYKMNPDSSFTYFKTFNNLYPIFMRNYNYESQDTLLLKTILCYDKRYPLNNIEIKGNSINIQIQNEAKYHLLLEYKYKSEKKNWYLTRKQIFIEFESGDEYHDIKLPIDQESIDEFSYMKYLGCY